MKPTVKPFLYADVETIPSQDPAVLAEIETKFPLPVLDLSGIKADGRLKDPAKMTKAAKGQTDEEFAVALQAAQDALDADIEKKRAAAVAGHQEDLAEVIVKRDAAYRKTALDSAAGHLASISWSFDEDQILEDNNTPLVMFDNNAISIGVFDSVKVGEYNLLTRFFSEIEETLESWAQTEAEEAWAAAKPHALENGRWQLNSTPDGSFVTTISDRDAWFRSQIAQAREIPIVVAHHADFDIRFIWQRCIALGVTVPAWWPINASKYRDDQVVDTMTMWAGHGNRISLDALCRALGIAGKQGFDGSMVWDAVRAGKITEVASYCSDDVKRLRSVHRRLRGLQPLLIDINTDALDIYCNGGDLDAYEVAPEGGMRLRGKPNTETIEVFSNNGGRVRSIVYERTVTPRPPAPDYPDDTPGWAFEGEENPQEWSTEHPVESGEQDGATNIRPCTWGQWKAEGVAYDAARKLERDTAFVNDIVAAVPLDFANAVDGNGNPVGWEE